MGWTLATRTLPLDRPFVIGILNVTPDSFSDGGQYESLEAAVTRAEVMLDAGADAIDIGGESTRPHNDGPVDSREELARVIPIVRAIRRRRGEAVLSIDTVKADVARAALEAGVDIVNDVSAFRLDPEMARVCAEARAGVILMHSRGAVADMATFTHAAYGPDPVGEIVGELARRLDAARAAGVADERIIIDPGIGFAKRGDVSVAVLHALDRVAALGRPVLVGGSRKRFVGELSGVSDPASRVYGSVGAHVAALARGARLFRVHDVRAHRQALDTAWPIVTGQTMERKASALR
jgi:dihydropteroate synthase